MGKLWTAYVMRLKRRRLLFRAFRKRRQLTSVVDRTAEISGDATLGFSTIRNELIRLPYFLEHHRKLGITHFLFVDNDSNDGTRNYLEKQPDVSLWTTAHSYKLSRFGVDWLTWLQIKYAQGHWCLTLDADELFIYPYCDERPLRALTDWLDTHSIASFGALMLDMYPKGVLNAQVYQSGTDPIKILSWFDADNFRSQMQPKLQNLWIQGGVRERVFFQSNPRRAPTMNKTPLVKWNRRYAYVSSTHSLLPRSLNHVFDGIGGGGKTTGAILHAKFLHTVSEKSREEKQRQEHFANSALYDRYYDSLIENPDLWCETSCKYTGWQQLLELGLMSKGSWQ